MRGGLAVTDFNILLFGGFETLDAFGAAEAVRCLPGAYRLGYFSREGGMVTSGQGMRVHTQSVLAAAPLDAPPSLDVAHKMDPGAGAMGEKGRVGG